MNRTALAAAALAAVIGLSSTACSGGGGQSVSTTTPSTTVASSIPSTTVVPSTATVPKATTVTIHPLFVRRGAGTADAGVGQEILTMEPTADHSLRVDFSEGVRSEVALSAALDLGQRQLASSVAGLRAKGIEPSLEVAA
ncbi:MAG TPA: hypothetical protein VKD67_01365 [Acidimicrobiales bacterium]|nr:hypothetical protein [Acidimicrobiales bacterium]